MLNLERLGHLTTELSTSLVKSLVLPPGLLGRRRTPPAAPRSEPRADENGRPYLATGCVILASAVAAADDVVVAVIRALGSRNLHLAVLPAGAAEDSEHVAASVAPFKRYGIPRLEIVPVYDRSRADDPTCAQQLLAADVILLCGDDPRRARTLLAGTDCGRAVAAFLAAGKLLVATGGVAAVLADRIVLPGEAESATIEVGLGLLPGLALAAGLDGRGAHQRLMHVVGSRLGGQFLGIEMGAASGVVIVGNEARVVGEGSVSFMDARDATRLTEECTPAPRTDGAVQPDDESVCGLKVHVLIEGYGLNLKTHRPLGPVREGGLQASGD